MKEMNYKKLCEQEKTLQFTHFSRKDALGIGLLLLKNAEKYSDPVSVEITVNGLVVFRCFADGAIPDSELWLQRKRNSVNLMQMSTLRFLYWLEEVAHESMTDRKLDANQYAAGGGGFPVVLEGTGCIGSICVSGMPQHTDDHQLIIDTLTEYLNK